MKSTRIADQVKIGLDELKVVIEGAKLSEGLASVTVCCCCSCSCGRSSKD
jgi:hypothetical protein